MRKAEMNILLILLLIILAFIGVVTFTGLGASYREVGGFRVVDEGNDYVCYEKSDIGLTGVTTGTLRQDGYDGCYAEYTTMQRYYEGNGEYRDLGVASRQSTTYQNGHTCLFSLGSDDNMLLDVKVCFYRGELNGDEVFEEVFNQVDDCNFICKIIRWFKELLARLGF